MTPFLPFVLIAGLALSSAPDALHAHARSSAFVRTSSSAAADYPLGFSPKATYPSGIACPIRSLSCTVGTATTHLTLPDTPTPYTDLTAAAAVPLPQSGSLTLQTDYAGSSLSATLFIDVNADGQFTTAASSGASSPSSQEQLATDAGGRTLTLQLPKGIQRGVYRARLVLMSTSATAVPEATATLPDEGGIVVDFLLNVHNNRGQIELITEHGNVFGTKSALPETTPLFQPLGLRAAAVATGYDLTELTIRHGHQLDGPQYVHGNRQWDIIERTAAGSFTLPADAVDGDLRITARFTPGANAQYLPVLIEEFDAPDGETQPNAELWHRSTRRHPTWARWISNAPEVVFLDGGHLVCRAIPTPASEKRKGETAPMITGAVETSGLFDFQYGKVEGRIKTNPHTGNFPAFWMMPTYVEGQKGWPWEGEIDIWEQIDLENTSVHTIHTHWTYDLRQTGNPPHTKFNSGVDMSLWHTYSVEWTPTLIRWSVDGRQVHAYTKKTQDADALANGQWPFDRRFYLILNQSVGNGTWAKPADERHTYETRFDWVRVYQTRAQNPLAGLDAPTLDTPGTSDPSTPDPNAPLYDLSGRRVQRPGSGIYIQGGRKVML